jgi:putative FmdB family regulatory protein
MPYHDFYCRSCKKSFLQDSKFTEDEEVDIVCPHCGSKEIEERWWEFSGHMLQNTASPQR